MRRFAALTVATILALTACGGGSDDASTPETDAPAETEASTDTEAPAETEAPADTTAAVETEAPADTTAPVETEAPADTDASAAGAVDVALVEWAVEAPTDIAAGTVTFNVSNPGNFPHHLAIARGDSYETLPQVAGGAVDEATLGADFLGRTANISSGEAETIEFDLEPGNYVLFCNIAGTVSHAAQGQTLSVTVTG